MFVIYVVLMYLVLVNGVQLGIPDFEGRHLTSTSTGSSRQSREAKVFARDELFIVVVLQYHVFKSFCFTVAIR